MNTYVKRAVGYFLRWYNGQRDKVGTNAAVQGMQVPRQEGQAVQAGI